MNDLLVDFRPINLNSHGLALGSIHDPSYTDFRPYERYYVIDPGTGTRTDLKVTRPRFLGSADYPVALNYRTISVTDSEGQVTTKVSPQVVGSRGTFWGSDGAAIWEEDLTSGQYQMQYLNQLIPSDSGWNLQYANDINDDGVIAAEGWYEPKDQDGNPAGDPQWRACLLLPFVLVDAKNKVLGDGDDVNIQTKATLLEKKDSSIAWIEPHGSEITPNDPDMPQLALRFSAIGRMGLRIKWKFAVKYDRPRGANPNEPRIREEDEIYIPKKVTGQQEQPWKEGDFDGVIELFNHPDWIAVLQEKGFFGGEAELKYQLLKTDGGALSSEEKILFSIGARNPEDSLVKQYIDAQAQAADNRLTRLSYAVGRHESKDYNGVSSRYNHSWESYARRFQVDHRKGDPLWCKAPSESSAGGFGIFQITGDLTSQFAIIPREQYWNWKRNVDAYVIFVKTGGSAAKGSVMDRFFAAVARTYPANADAQGAPTNYPYDGGSYDAWEMGTITLYNGAGKCPQSSLKMPNGKFKKLTNPWTYSPSNTPGTRWEYHPNSNNYLHEVIQER